MKKLAMSKNDPRRNPKWRARNAAKNRKMARDPAWLEANAKSVASDAWRLGIKRRDKDPEVHVKRVVSARKRARKGTARNGP